MALSLQEFKDRVARDEKAGGKICGHNGCKNKLGPRVDGEHHAIGGKPVCDGCYFDAFSDEIDKHPLVMPRIRRGG